MAFFDSSLSVFLITDTVGSLRDITPYVVSIDGLPGERELGDVTALGDTGHKFQPTLQNVTFTLELLWSNDAGVGADTVLGPLLTHTSAVAFQYGPSGSTAGKVKYSGSAWVKAYPINSSAGKMVSARCEFQVHGVVTRGTF
jgi:hypothetical protein